HRRRARPRSSSGRAGAVSACSAPSAVMRRDDPAAVGQAGGMIPVAPDPAAVSVLTQNIRLPRPDTSPGEADHWEDRAPVLVDLLRRADPDLVGTQEVLPGQIPVLDEALAGTHLRLGCGRDGGWLRRFRPTPFVG